MDIEITIYHIESTVPIFKIVNIQYLMNIFFWICCFVRKLVDFNNLKYLLVVYYKLQYHGESN